MVTHRGSSGWVPLACTPPTAAQSAGAQNPLGNPPSRSHCSCPCRKILPCVHPAVQCSWGTRTGRGTRGLGGTGTSWTPPGLGRSAAWWCSGPVSPEHPTLHWAEPSGNQHLRVHKDGEGYEDEKKILVTKIKSLKSREQNVLTCLGISIEKLIPSTKHKYVRSKNTFYVAMIVRGHFRTKVERISYCIRKYLIHAYTMSAILCANDY